MDSSRGQDERREGRRSRRGEDTRAALLQASAELIAELGWGRVTTRAIAKRAELPHGTVSYHFAGKQELLTEAAVAAIEQSFPMGGLARLETLDDLLHLVSAWVVDRSSSDPTLSPLLTEAMRESTRNPTLRDYLATMLREYRRVVTSVVRAERARGDLQALPGPAGLAALIVAAGDGLTLHALLDPELDIVAAVEALRTLLDTDGPATFGGCGRSQANA